MQNTKQVKLDMDVGSSELPHPEQKNQKVSPTADAASERSTFADASLCEGWCTNINKSVCSHFIFIMLFVFFSIDAHFVYRFKSQVYLDT
jgi:hypothetical protein